MTKAGNFIFVLTLFASLLWSCKNDPRENENTSIPTTQPEEQAIEFDTLANPGRDLDLPQQVDIEIRKKELVDRPDERKELEQLIISKRFYKDEDLYTIDFKYPYLNEQLKPSYANFNEYIQGTYLDIEGVEAQILEDKELLCDTLRINKYREKRYVDYKVYNVNDRLVSVLFYKENFYSGTLHPSFTFDCLNFDLDRAVFMNYEDFFIEGSEEELRKIINELLDKKIKSGEMYYDCWGISEEDFFEYKDNFVVDDRRVEYYFDDCVICPTYTGNFSISIPLEELLPVLRKYNLNPLQL
jgi:hypothetical protein